MSLKQFVFPLSFANTMCDIWKMVAAKSHPFWARIGFGSIFLLIAALVTGCQDKAEIIPEVDERAYRRGKSLLKEGRESQALSQFLSVIEIRRMAPESHLEAGILYLNHVQDPLSAIYHFKKYLEVKPNGEHSDFVRDLILTATKEFARSLPAQPLAEGVERLDMLESLKQLKAQNLALRERIVELEMQAEASSNQVERLNEALASSRSERGLAPIVIATPDNAAASSSETAPDRPDTYEVQSGDTLTAISRKMYGVSSRWMDIYQANRDQLSRPEAVKPGQVLRIP